MARGILQAIIVVAAAVLVVADVVVYEEVSGKNGLRAFLLCCLQQSCLELLHWVTHSLASLETYSTIALEVTVGASRSEGSRSWDFLKRELAKKHQGVECTRS